MPLGKILFPIRVNFWFNSPRPSLNFPIRFPYFFIVIRGALQRSLLCTVLLTCLTVPTWICRCLCPVLLTHGATSQINENTLPAFACYLCRRSVLADIQCNLRLVVEPIVPCCAMVEWWEHDLLKEFLQWLTIIALLTSVVLNIFLILEAIERRRKQNPKAK